MGRIKWDSLLIAETMDNIEDTLMLQQPALDALIAQVDAAAALPNLPDYMKYSLSSLRSQLHGCLPYCCYKIHSVKHAIPATAPTTPKRQTVYHSEVEDLSPRSPWTAEEERELQEAEEREIDRMLDIAPADPAKLAAYQDASAQLRLLV